jgi:proline iminopeptidase
VNHQILFLDQRGTGLSSTITAGTLALQGDAIKQAEYLKNFRADNIVRDCEAVRHCLTKDYPADQRKWSVLGQSFGGFCIVTYLSKLYVVTRALFLLLPAPLTFLLYHSPEGLKEAFITGGLAPLVDGPDRVYQRTYGLYTPTTFGVSTCLLTRYQKRWKRETRRTTPSFLKTLNA